MAAVDVAAYRKSCIIDPDAAPADHGAKAPYVDNGFGPISPERYYSMEWMEAERRHLWSRVWNWACREEDIPLAGDYVKFDLGRESFIVTRGDDGAIRAFYNVCPHRGNRIVTDEDGARPQGFACRFHNWRFSLSGENTHVTDRETFREDALCRNRDLRQARCETWEGFVFINMDEEAAPLLDQIGPLCEHAKPYRVRDMRIMRRVQAVWEANWKVGVDGFNEAYHVHAIHPQILPVFDDYHAQIDLYPNGMSRMTTRFAHQSPRMNEEGLNPALRAAMEEVGLDPDVFEGRMEDVRPAIQKAKRKRAERLGIDYSMFSDNQLTDDWNYDIFPNIQMGMHPEGISMLYFRPHATDPRKFIFDVIVLMHPQHDTDILPPAYMGLPDGTDLSGREPVEIEHVDWRKGGLGELFDQDASLFADVQKGMESASYEGAILSEQEQRIGHFHAELERYLAGAMSG